MNSNLSPPPLSLDWTDYPMLDTALAGLCVFAGVKSPTLLTPEYLEEFIEWAEEAYFTTEMTGWLSVGFTTNFLNSSFSTEKKKTVLRDILTSYQRPNELSENCSLFPHLKAQQRVSRDLMPMLLGRGFMNFYPEGNGGLPLSGQAITALQGLSVVAPLVSGSVIILDADDKNLLLRIAKTWQPEWRNRILLSLTNGGKSPTWSYPRTRLVQALRDIMRLRPSNDLLDDEGSNTFRGGVTIYHVSNSGQNPGVQIYSLERPAIQFMHKAEWKYPETWQALVYSQTQFDKKNDDHFGTRSKLDEDLFGLPEYADRFIRWYFMPAFKQAFTASNAPQARKKSRKSGKGTKAKTNASEEMGVGHLADFWGLTRLFLLEVVGMEKARIEAIERLGTRLGEWIVFENDNGLFRELYEARGASSLRHILLKAMVAKAKHDAKSAAAAPHEHQELLTSTDEYLLIFTEADELARADFTLARDLLKMRIIQHLHEANFFQKNKDNPEIEQLALETEKEQGE